MGPGFSSPGPTFLFYPSISTATPAIETTEPMIPLAPVFSFFIKYIMGIIITGIIPPNVAAIPTFVYPRAKISSQIAVIA